MPQEQLAFNSKYKEKAFNNIINGGCVTAISSDLAITYSHGSHKQLKVYSDDGNADNSKSIVTIRNVSNLSTSHEAKVLLSN
jgi:hypothetical protein